MTDSNHRYKTTHYTVRYIWPSFLRHVWKVLNADGTYKCVFIENCGKVWLKKIGSVQCAKKYKKFLEMNA